MGEKDFLELGGAEDLSSKLETKSTLCGFQPKPSIKVNQATGFPNQGKPCYWLSPSR